LGGDGLAKRNQLAEVVGQLLRARVQFGHHRSKQHGGAKRLQRIFGPYQQGRRRAPSGAASTSTISERRESSEPRICCSWLSSGRSRASASPIRVSTLRTWAAMSISCALSLLRS